AGISSYANDPPQAGQSLRPCLNQVLNYIPSEKQQKTHICLGATAGMRLLEIQNQSQSRMILDEVSRTIRSYPFRFHEARIISGIDEGIYGWISVNYLLESFLKYSWDGNWLHPESAQIQGALDLGGSSTQITFTPTPASNHTPAEMGLKLYGYDYNVYTHSYLCYGQQQFIKKYIATLLKGVNLNTPIENPCYLRGYETNLTLGSIYDSVCTSAQRPSPYDRTQNVTVFGSGKITECKQAIKAVFNFTACRGSANCSFDGVYQPAVNGPFYVNVAHPNERHDRLRDYCTSATYIYTLLVDGYKFDSDTWKNIVFKEKASNTDIGWTLGYMLNLTNMIPSQSPDTVKAQYRALWTASCFFRVMTILLALASLLTSFLKESQPSG
ncbi:ectonucleoside triphosphate diphosphohydrolase 8-like, partial [Heptranchias perlo]|uniref:ectonucleoside triphosphate diphosphohydrolase 8-like n=1 Tax=Heptranchias perlo TaxID=212740 RepID=UPI00355940DD